MSATGITYAGDEQKALADMSAVSSRLKSAR
jgi:hypothetical protein